MKLFGAGHVYEGREPFEPLKAAALGITKQMIQEAWSGFGTEEKRKAAIQGEVDELLKEASKAAQGKSPDMVVVDLLPQVGAKAEGLYQAWHVEVEGRLAKIRVAIASGEAKGLSENFRPLSDLFWSEIRLLNSVKVAASLATLNFERELTRELLPSFGDFRNEVIGRVNSLSHDAKPNLEKFLVDNEKEYIKLGDQLKSLTEKKEQDSTGGKQLQAQISHLSDLRAAAWHSHLQFVKLQRTLRNYLGNLEEAKKALQADAAELATNRLKEFYFRKQFFKTKTDARGKKMDMVPSDILEDLNEIAGNLSIPILASDERKKSYLDDLTNYCKTGLGDSLKKDFTEAYWKGFEESIQKLGGTAQEWAKGSEQLESVVRYFAPDVNPGPRTMIEARFKRIWGRVANVQHPVKDFDGWFASLVRVAPVSPLLRKELKKVLPTPEEFCGYIQHHRDGLYQIKYDDILQVTGDVLFSESSHLGPLVDDEGKLHWFKTSPVSDFPPVSGYEPFGGVLLGRGDQGTTQVLVSFLKETDYPLADLLRLASEPEFAHSPTRFELLRKVFLPHTKLIGQLGQVIPSRFVTNPTSLLNQLSVGERAALYGRISQLIKDGLRKKAKVNLFSEKKEVALEYEPWRARLFAFFYYYDAIKREVSKDKSDLVAYEHPEFKALATTIARHFLGYTDYKLEGDHLVRGAEEGDFESSMKLFASHSPAVQRRIVQDIEELYQEERERGSYSEGQQPLPPLYEAFTNSPYAPTRQIETSAEEVRIAFYSENFAFKAVTAAHPTIEDWIAFHQMREFRALPNYSNWTFRFPTWSSGLPQETPAATEQGDTKTAATEETYNPLRSTHHQAVVFQNWLKSWTNSPMAFERFKQLKTSYENKDSINFDDLQKDFDERQKEQFANLKKDFDTKKEKELEALKKNLKAKALLVSLVHLKGFKAAKGDILARFEKEREEATAEFKAKFEEGKEKRFERLKRSIQGDPTLRIEEMRENFEENEKHHYEALLTRFEAEKAVEYKKLTAKANAKGLLMHSFQGKDFPGIQERDLGGAGNSV